MKVPFSIIFLCLFDNNESIFKQLHLGNAAKGAKIDVLQLLKLKNVLCHQPWLGQSQGV